MRRKEKEQNPNSTTGFPNSVVQSFVAILSLKITFCSIQQSKFLSTFIYYAVPLMAIYDAHFCFLAPLQQFFLFKRPSP